jgi:hypothetical protein
LGLRISVNEAIRLVSFSIRACGAKLGKLQTKAAEKTDVKAWAKN